MLPDHVVLTLNASLEIEKDIDSNPDEAFEVLFDSMVHSRPTGIRASVVSGRQFLYRIGSVYVDVQVDRSANSDRASLVGQMLDSSRPGQPMVGISVALLDKRQNLARTSSNHNGEFQFEFDLRSNLKLAIWMRDGHCVHLPMTNIELP